MMLEKMSENLIKPCRYYQYVFLWLLGTLFYPEIPIRVGNIQSKVSKLPYFLLCNFYGTLKHHMFTRIAYKHKHKKQ